MSKYCANCKKEVKDEANFCPLCGYGEFISEEKSHRSNTTVLNPEDNYTTVLGNYEEENGTSVLEEQQEYRETTVPRSEETSYSYQLPEPKKRQDNKLPIIIVAIVVGVIVAIIAFLAVANIGEKDSQEDNTTNNGYSSGTVEDEKEENNSEEDSNIEYTKGSFDGKEYVNEWANIRLEVPKGYTEGSDENYASFESITTDCGLYLVSENSEMYSISYETVKYAAIHSKEDYIDNFDKMLSATPQGASYEKVDSEPYVTIATKEYSVIHYKIYGVTYQSIYVRQIGDYMMSIIVIGESPEYNNSLVGSIKEYK